MQDIRTDGKKIHYKKALFYVLGSVMLLWGFFFGVKKVYTLLRNGDFTYDESPIIACVVQSTDMPIEPLYIEEILDLSQDDPISLSSFNTALAKKKLENSPFIKHARVKVIKPGIALVDLTCRKPIALVADYENTALDKEGYLFPLVPFFRPKLLPEIFFGFSLLRHGETIEPEIPKWGVPSNKNLVDFAFSVLNFLDNRLPEQYRVLKLDVAKTFVPSAGEREIVVVIQEKRRRSDAKGFYIQDFFVRCNIKTYREDFERFFLLCDFLKNNEQKEISTTNVAYYTMLKSHIIDLRMRGIALIKTM